MGDESLSNRKSSCFIGARINHFKLVRLKPEPPFGLQTAYGSGKGCALKAMGLSSLVNRLRRSTGRRIEHWPSCAWFILGKWMTGKKK